MSFDWRQMPVILAERRAQLVTELVATDDHAHGVRVVIGGDELLRLPEEAESELDLKRSFEEPRDAT